MRTFTSVQDLNKITNSELPILVDFYADWCSTCQTMESIIEGLKSTLQGRVDFLKINADEHPQIVAAFRVQNVPTFILYNQGKEQLRKVGIITYTQFLKEIEKALLATE
jgi:thioredoxin 1